MIKKIYYILILIIVVSSINPIQAKAEKLIDTPTVFTESNAPHSAKPKTTKKKTVRNLKLGMVGSDVVTLQKFLIKKNVGPAAKALAEGKATGRFGPLTKDALIEFQKAKGLTPDGIAGAKIRALYNK